MSLWTAVFRSSFSELDSPFCTSALFRIKGEPGHVKSPVPSQHARATDPNHSLAVDKNFLSGALPWLKITPLQSARNSDRAPSWHTCISSTYVPIDFQINDFTALSVEILDDVPACTPYSGFSLCPCEINHLKNYIILCIFNWLIQFSTACCPGVGAVKPIAKTVHRRHPVNREYTV